MKRFAGVGVLVCAALFGACSSSVQSFASVPAGSAPTGSSPMSPGPRADASASPAPTAACTVTVTAPTGMPAHACILPPPQRDRPPAPCCAPRPPEPPPPPPPFAQPIAAYCVNLLPNAVAPAPPAADDSACARRLAELERKLGDPSRAPSMKLRVGFGSFFAEAADEDSRATILYLGFLLAFLVGALIWLTWRLTGKLSSALTEVTIGLAKAGNEGAKAIDRLAKGVFAVAAAIVLLMLAVLLMGAFSLFGDSGQRSAVTAVAPGPTISTAPLSERDSALVTTAIEALGRAAQAPPASPASDHQLLAGLAGAGVGLAIGVLAALLYGALSRAQLLVDRGVLAAPSRAPKPGAEGEPSTS